MKLLERYLWKNILGSILVTWVSLSLLFGLFDFLSELGDVKADTRYGTWQALLYILYKLPRTLYTNFPYAVLIGSLMGLGNLAANSEITAMRAAGYSIGQIVGTTLKLGLVLAVLAFGMGEWIAPRTETWAENFKLNRLQQEVVLSEDGAWIKNGSNLIHVDKLSSPLAMEGISIYTVDEQAGGISRILRARSAYRSQSQTRWVLIDVQEQRLDGTSASLSSHPQLNEPDLLPIRILNIATVTPEQLDARALAEFIRHQRENALSSERFELEYWKHFTTPLSTLVMLILAAPLVFGFQRNAGAGQRIFIGILIGISYLMLDSIISRTGMLYGLPPLLSAVLPMLLFSVAGLLMLRRVR
ncbi:MAG: LPS export ABC transporter permease LptG [Thiothrix sp.]|nr:LPS export ABC transporter permease LptG [Thiothrix sp.]HPQ94760.1 LPS export ABC transporter permease LptG [Thiolinea sp.]